MKDRIDPGELDEIFEQSGHWEEETRGVYYVSIPDCGECYILHRDAPLISEEAKSYGKPLVGHPKKATPPFWIPLYSPRSSTRNTSGHIPSPWTRHAESPLGIKFWTTASIGWRRTKALSFWQSATLSGPQSLMTRLTAHLDYRRSMTESMG